MLYIYSGFRQQEIDSDLCQLFGLLSKNNKLLFFGVSEALCLMNSQYNELFGDSLYREFSVLLKSFLQNSFFRYSRPTNCNVSCFRGVFSFNDCMLAQKIWVTKHIRLAETHGTLH